MRPADDPSIDYRALVRAGYDRCAGAYEAARAAGAPVELAPLVGRLADGAAVLDLGCGCGVPVARELARRHAVTGVDLAAEQIRRARRNVPAARFIQGDLMTVTLPAGRFDAAVALYAIFHLPREEHPALFRRIAAWLKPGGLLLATLSRVAEAAYTEEDFFGVTMYWSNWGLDDYAGLLRAAGFERLVTTTVGAGYGQETAHRERHPLVLARRGEKSGAWRGARSE